MSMNYGPMEKYELLKNKLVNCESVAIAFSGGVDSAFLLHAAKDALNEKVLAITAISAAVPDREIQEARKFCEERNIRHIEFDADVLQEEVFRKNDRERCYSCKKALFSQILTIASQNGIRYVCEGSNMDDLGDYRPGMRAIRELKVLSPLQECKFLKSDIRILSHEFGLPTWNKQSFACLASRFPYGDEITAEKLKMVARSEQLLLDMGLNQLRVRVHGKIARIEVLPDSLPKMIKDSTRKKIYEAFRSYGFEYVTLDLLGYRTGSMNETLIAEDKTL